MAVSSSESAKKNFVNIRILHSKETHGRTDLRRTQSPPCRVGKDRRTPHRIARISSQRKRWSQRLWLGTISGYTLLRAVDTAAGAGRKSPSLSRRKQRKVEAQRKVIISYIFFAAASAAGCICSTGINLVG